MTYVIDIHCQTCGTSYHIYEPTTNCQCPDCGTIWVLWPTPLAQAKVVVGERCERQIGKVWSRSWKAKKPNGWRYREN